MLIPFQNIQEYSPEIERKALHRESHGENNLWVKNAVCMSVCTLDRRKTEPCISKEGKNSQVLVPASDKKLKHNISVKEIRRKKREIRSLSHWTLQEVPSEIWKYSRDFLKWWYMSNWTEFSASFHKVKNNSFFQNLIFTYTKIYFRVFQENEVCSCVQAYIFQAFERQKNPDQFL